MDQAPRRPRERAQRSRMLRDEVLGLPANVRRVIVLTEQGREVNHVGQ